VAEGPAAAPGLAGLLLAAGAARRFGGPKALVHYRGEPLVARAARRLAGCCGAGVTVVVGAAAAKVAAALPVLPGLQVVENPRWPTGLACSLAAGLAVQPAAVTAVLVLLADQPLVDEADLARLVAAWRRSPDRIAAARFDAVAGVPAILPRSAWPALAALEGDQGARAVIAAAPDRVEVSMPHAARDVDTPDDLARLP
jgi:CTP:molybdopterin cytidylyltransferase MocA